MHLRAVSVCLALAFAGAASADLPEIDIPFVKFTLDNGLRVIVHEDRKAPIVAVNVWYHVGSKDEVPGKTGFAHLFEHLMYNGSENYDDEYFKPFEQVGATAINGTTWFDRTNYFQNVPTPALEMALWMESDRMGHLLGAVTQQKLDEQRAVVQNEKRQGDNEPYGLVEYRVLEGLFPEGHPYRWSTIGSMADLNAASLEDVHEWFRTYYGAANAIVVLAGDIDAETARPLMDKYFGDIAAGPPLRRLGAWVPELGQIKRETMYDQVPHARIYRYWAIPGRTDESSAALSLTAAVLGQGKNSRLYKKLVYDLQLATNVSVDIEPHEIASMFSIDVTLKPDADRGEVLALIDEVLAEFLREGPRMEELERARTRINAAVIRGLEQVGGMSGKAATLARGELYAGDPAEYRRKLAMLNALPPAQVLAGARVWLDRAYYQLEVLPFPQYATTTGGADRSALPEVGGMPDLSFPSLERARLRNGLEVVLAQRDTVPIVNMALQFDAGYAADNRDALGTASFALAMLDEGTRTRSALEIAAQSELLGANIGAGSNLDTSSVTLSALVAKLDESVALFADMLRNPAFDQHEIDRLRRRWLASIEQEKVQPVSIALRTLPPLLYGDRHAYGIPFTGSGTQESIAALTRDDLVAFHRDWLRPDNGTLFVVGDTTMPELLPVLERHLGSWRPPRSPRPVKNVEAVTPPEAGRVYLIDKPGAPQSLILAGHLAPPTGVENNLAIETMNDVLGGQFTARVNMNLREDKGWAYGAYTILWGARGQRPWLVYAPVQTDRTVDSITELLGEFDTYLGEQPATENEVERVVRNQVNSLPGEFETGGAVLGALLSNARYGRPDDYVQTLKDRYAALSAAEVRAAASQVLRPRELCWVIVGDLAQIADPIRELGLGEVTLLDADGRPTAVANDMATSAP